MSIEDLKVKPEILSPKPPSIATDEEFASGTSTTASPTVKQAKEKLVTTDTTQTIAGQKAFIAQLLKKSTVIDITTQPEKYTANNGFVFVDKNGNTMGFLENAQMVSGEIKTGIHARNKDGYQANIGVYAPLSGTTGAYATAPNTPDNAPANAIVTKNKIANMVTTDTAQAITGTKTFKSVVTAELEPINFIAKNPTMDVNQTPSSNKYVGYDFRDKNNVRIGYIGISQDTNGTFKYEIQKPGNYVTRILGITPPVDSGSNEMVTAQWFNSKMQVVSALPANPDPNVFYFIPG